MPPRFLLPTARLLAFQHGSDGCGDRLFTGSLADQPLDDGAGRIFGNSTNARHRRLFAGSDGIFGIHELCVEFALKRLATLVSLRRLPLTRVIGDGLRSRTRIGKSLFVSSDSGVRFPFQPGGLSDVVSDVLVPVIKNRTDAR